MPPESGRVRADNPGTAGMLARRAELTGRAREFARRARAESTWAAYEDKWARFTTWCAGHDETPLPAEPLTVARFLTDLAPHWRPATPNRCLRGHRGRPRADPTGAAALVDRRLSGGDLGGPPGGG